MLKREISYTDFEGNQQSGEFHFNLTKSELVEIEVEYQEGLEKALLRVIRTNDRQAMLVLFKRIILDSYGEREDDLFIKDEAAKRRFEFSPAFDALFVELASDEDAAAQFINGIMPADIQALAAQQAIQDKPTGPPPTPVTAENTPNLPPPPAV